MYADRQPDQVGRQESLAGRQAEGFSRQTVLVLPQGGLHYKVGGRSSRQAGMLVLQLQI